MVGSLQDGIPDTSLGLDETFTQGLKIIEEKGVFFYIDICKW